MYPNVACECVMHRITRPDPAVNRSGVSSLSPEVGRVNQVHIAAGLHAANARLQEMRTARLVSRETVRRVAPGQLFSVVNEGKRESTGVETVRAFPEVLAGFLREGVAAEGRVWLLLRALDGVGKGWVDVEGLRERLTGKESAWRICGWRRLRQVLGAGKGRLWERDDRGRVWVYGAGRVASELGVARVGRAVELPIGELLGGIGAIRAHFYAAFHSGRVKEDGGANPIGRRALEQATGASERSQRRYDVRLGVEKRGNVAVGGVFSAESRQAATWVGHVAFEFQDFTGRIGPAGLKYVAWRLPNAYGAVHAQCGRGRARKINRRLRKEQSANGLYVTTSDDLVMQRARGNGDGAANLRTYNRVYFDSGTATANGYLRVERSVWCPVDNQRETLGKE